MLTRVVMLAGAFALGLVLPALAHEYKLGEITIGHPWARASIGQAANSAAYLTLANHGQATDSLKAVECQVARKCEIHTHLMEDGVMKMRQIEAIEIDPGTPAVLQPGGLHVMLIGLEQPLMAGESFPLTLVFEKAGKIEVEVKVEDPATKHAPEKMEQKHDHSS